MSWWQRFTRFCREQDPEYDPVSDSYAGQMLLKSLPSDRRCHYGLDCGHTWAWSRGEECPECRLQAAYDAQAARLAAMEQERDQARALNNAYRIEQRRQAAILDPKIERWAALETAARAFVARGAAPGGPQTAQAFVALFEALAALDGPAGEPR